MSVQQDRSLYDARNVQPVREHGKKARTPLAAFFNIPEKTNLIWRVPITQVGPNSKGGQMTISSPLFGRQFTASYCLSRAECFGKSKGKSTTCLLDAVAQLPSSPFLSVFFGRLSSVIPGIRNRGSIFSSFCRGFAPERRDPFLSGKGPKTIDAQSGHTTWAGR